MAGPVASSLLSHEQFSVVCQVLGTIGLIPVLHKLILNMYFKLYAKKVDLNLKVIDGFTYGILGLKKLRIYASTDSVVPNIFFIKSVDVKEKSLLRRAAKRRPTRSFVMFNSAYEEIEPVKLKQLLFSVIMFMLGYLFSLAQT